MQNDNVLTDEQREQLELIERCQPDLLLMHIRENTAFDVALLERVFELAKERAHALLASHEAPSEPRIVTGDYEVDHGTHVELRPIYNEPEPRAEATEEQPSLSNPLTPYGMLVRALRIVSGTTLMDMAKALLSTPAKLSAMEFGRAPITLDFALDVAAYFDALGVPDTLVAIRRAIDAARTGASS